MHPVKCVYCEKTFDRDKEEFIKVNTTRYAHKKCAEKKNGGEISENNFIKKSDLKKCFYCGKDIDISKEEYKLPRVNRYAHAACYDKNYTPDEEFVDKIYSFLKEEMGISYDFLTCERQRVNFIQKMGYTNEGILNALKYFYLVKKQSPEKSGNRIGIVPYVYNEAKEYYENLNKARNKATKLIGKQIKDGEKVFNVINIHKKELKNLIDIDSIEIGEENGR